MIADAERVLEDYRRLKGLGLINRSGEFFPSGVHYPPITMYQPITQEELFKTYRLPEMVSLTSIPISPSVSSAACSATTRLNSENSHWRRIFILAPWEKEMDIYLAQLGLDRVKARSILVGGGTPTYLTIPQLRRFLDFYVKKIDLTKCTQFNYDVDPNTLIGPEGKNGCASCGTMASIASPSASSLSMIRRLPT